MAERMIPGPDATAEEWGLLARDSAGFRLLPGMRLVGQDGSAWRTCANGIDVCADERWMLANYSTVYPPNLQINYWPDPDDHATAGALLALLGGAVDLRIGSRRNVAPWVHECIVGDDQSHDGRIHTIRQPTVGRLCIAVAAALGGWPGGEE